MSRNRTGYDRTSPRTCPSRSLGESLLGRAATAILPHRSPPPSTKSTNEPPRSQGPQIPETDHRTLACYTGNLVSNPHGMAQQQRSRRCHQLHSVAVSKLSPNTIGGK